MRILRPAAGLLLCAILLSGCLPREPIDPPSPEPSSTPVFASEEEALAAAEEAYAAYQAAVDHALATYDTEGLESVASGDALDAARTSVTSFRDGGRRQTGKSSVDSIRLMSDGGLLSGADGQLQIYACLDVTNTDVLDAAGSSTLTAPRQTRYPVEISLSAEDGPDGLLVVSEAVWDGNDFCN